MDDDARAWTEITVIILVALMLLAVIWGFIAYTADHKHSRDEDCVIVGKLNNGNAIIVCDRAAKERYK